MQTDTTETLGLKSKQYSQDYSMNGGDYFTVDLQTTSDNAQLKLYDSGALQTTLDLLIANTETSRQEAEVYIPEDITYDQIKITSELDDKEYFKLYNIDATHWIFEDSEDQRSMYVEPFGQNEMIANYGNNTLKVYENEILRNQTTINIGYDLTTVVYNSPLPETIFVSLYDSDNNYLDFNKFTVWVDYTLYDEDFTNQRLTSREFYVDERTYIDFTIYDSFNSSVYNQQRLAKTFIDITLPVYQLKIKNEKLNPVVYSLSKNEISKSGSLFENEILRFNLAAANYSFLYTEEGSSESTTFNFTLNDDQYFVLNRSQMCFISLADQRGNFLSFENFRVYVNNSQIYENIFYEDIGTNITIEIRDRFNISLTNYSYVINKGDNYIPITLTMYSLKVYNQQETYNFINITRDPNYYTIHNYWSEYMVPNELVEFRLFAGYYRINITNNEDSSSSSYAYTLNSDDVIIISSDNTITNMIYDISNVNVSLGNQITNVEISISNQNSEINSTIINLSIDLSSVNSTLNNFLLNIDTDISNLQSDVDTLWFMSENSFLFLNSSVETGFINVISNITAINTSISTLIIGIDNKISIMNSTVNTILTEMRQGFIQVETRVNFSFASLNQSLTQIANNISNNYVLLENLIVQRANQIDNSLINIQTLINLLNSSVANNSLVIQSLINIMSNNITNNQVTINNIINEIGNNITQNNAQLTNLIEVTENNITANQFVIQTLIDYVSNNITTNQLELLNNLNFINNNISSNYVDIVNRLLFINNTMLQMINDLQTQIIFLNGTVYNALLNVSTSIDLNSDMILGNISLTYQQNDFLTNLTKKMVFADLLDWSDVSFNNSAILNQVDVYDIINYYRNQSILVELKYKNETDSLIVTAQDQLEKYLPKQDVEYRLKSVDSGKYLTNWTAVENKTIDFGFYKDQNIPAYPEPFNPIVLMIVFGAFVIAVLAYLFLLNVHLRFQKKQEKNKIKKSSGKKSKSWKNDDTII